MELLTLVAIVFYLLSAIVFVLIWESDILERVGMAWWNRYEKPKARARLEANRKNFTPKTKRFNISPPPIRAAAVEPTNPVTDQVITGPTEAINPPAWLVTVADVVNMLSDMGPVEDHAELVVKWAYENLDGRLIVSSLYAQFQEQEAIPQKLRARRFYEALAYALRKSDLAACPSKKEGTRLNSAGLQYFGLGGHWQP